MSGEKTIVSLGLRRSGKTNYIAAALVYMATHYSRRKGSRKWYFPRFRQWAIEQKNVGISGLIDGFEDHLKQGKWYDRTSEEAKNIFCFDVSRSILLPQILASSKSITVHDWPGEVFSALVKADPDISSDNLADFRNDCRTAENFILCLDGENLDNEKKKEVQDALRKFCKLVGWLKDDKSGQDDDNGGNAEVAKAVGIRRNIAIVVTKSDLLTDLDDLHEQDPNRLNLDRLTMKVQESYRSFFGILQNQHCRVGVFPVSLVPFAEFRKDDPTYGRIPVVDKWQLDKVMESSLIDEASRREFGERYYGNMYGAFLWLLEKT